MRSRAETRVRALFGHSALLWRTAKISYFAWRRLLLDATWRSKRDVLALQPGGLQVHLGCGDRHIVGMLNIDARVTRAADRVADCSRLRGFADGSLAMIFSHAFFEHLYQRQQLPLLRDCARTLRPGGLLVFVGIPDFECVCREYLDTARGSNIGEHSRLEWAFHYTHGVPAPYPGWSLTQLHKSLFDADTLSELARGAGFATSIVFHYCYPGEVWRVGLGLCAGSSVSETTMRQTLERFEDYVDVSTVEAAAVRSQI